MTRPSTDEIRFLIGYLIAEAAMTETEKDLERARSIAVELENENARLSKQVEELLEIANTSYDRYEPHKGCVEASDIELVLGPREESVDLTY
jgi:hypothetical protein